MAPGLSCGPEKIAPQGLHEPEAGFRPGLSRSPLSDLTGLAALRVDVGNDYGKYVETFHEIYAGTDQAYVVTERGSISQ